MKRIARHLLWPSVVLSALLGVIGFAHTPQGRPLLAFLRGAPGCPVDFDGVDARTSERFRLKQVDRLRGAAPARSRQVLGLDLGATTLAQARATLEQHAERCEVSQHDSTLRCAGVKLERARCDAPAIDDLVLRFDERGVLVAIDLFREATSSKHALSLLAQRGDVLAQAIGAATSTGGEASAQYLDAVPLRRASLEYRYADVFAELSAISLGARGVRVREQYQFLPARRA